MTGLSQFGLSFFLFQATTIKTRHKNRFGIKGASFWVKVCCPPFCASGDMGSFMNGYLLMILMQNRIFGTIWLKNHQTFHHNLQFFKKLYKAIIINDLISPEAQKGGQQMLTQNEAYLIPNRFLCPFLMVVTWNKKKLNPNCGLFNTSLTVAPSHHINFVNVSRVAPYLNSVYKLSFPVLLI